MHALTRQFLDQIQTPDLPSLGPDPRPSRAPLNDLESRMELWFADTALPVAHRPTLRAAALLWHDYLQNTHSLAQSIATAEGSFLHAVMHRREPDYDNAKYWFHRVGRHEAFYSIARTATPLLVRQRENQLAAQLLPNGLWDPFAFVDACASACQPGPAAPSHSTLREIQRIEFESLVDAFLSRITP